MRWTAYTMRTKIFAILVLSFGLSLAANDLVFFRSSAKQLIARENDSYAPDSTWNQFVNQALNKVTEKCSCVVAYDTIVTTADQREDSLNSNFSKIWSVYNATNKKMLQQILAEQKGILPNSEVNTPIFFYIQGTKIGWDAIPGLADSMFLTYFRSYKKLTTTDTVTNVPVEFHNAVVLYTCHFALLREKDLMAVSFLLEGDKDVAEVRAGKLRSVDLLKLQRKIP